MKLLFDHHLSRKLATRLRDLFPESSHVVFHGLEATEDIAIWLFARANDYVIVTKDSDFNDVSTLRGAPPKIIWLRVGNCTTAMIETLMRSQVATIELFLHDPDSTILEIYRQ
jgi:predicted nuclease of predicted toxin-antitoxin system